MLITCSITSGSFDPVLHVLARFHIWCYLLLYDRMVSFMCVIMIHVVGSEMDRWWNLCACLLSSYYCWHLPLDLINIFLIWNLLQLDAASIPCKRYTVNPAPDGGHKCDTLQVFSVKVAELTGGLQWPLDVFGMVALRDMLDHNRNIIFKRGRDNCQTLTDEVHVFLTYHHSFFFMCYLFLHNFWCTFYLSYCYHGCMHEIPLLNNH